MQPHLQHSCVVCLPTMLKPFKCCQETWSESLPLCFIPSGCRFSDTHNKKNSLSKYMLYHSIWSKGLWKRKSITLIHSICIKVCDSECSESPHLQLWVMVAILGGRWTTYQLWFAEICGFRQWCALFLQGWVCQRQESKAWCRGLWCVCGVLGCLSSLLIHEGLLVGSEDMGKRTKLGCMEETRGPSWCDGGKEDHVPTHPHSCPPAQSAHTCKGFILFSGWKRLIPCVHLWEDTELPTVKQKSSCAVPESKQKVWGKREMGTHP